MFSDFIQTENPQPQQISCEEFKNGKVLILEHGICPESVWCIMLSNDPLNPIREKAKMRIENSQTTDSSGCEIFRII
jgi:hypothetical protein